LLLFQIQRVLLHGDAIEPNESQQGRDDSEAPRMAKFVAAHARVFHYGEMMSESESESDGESK
jgi:hypothetical protein